MSALLLRLGGALLAVAFGGAALLPLTFGDYAAAAIRAREERTEYVAVPGRVVVDPRRLVPLPEFVGEAAPFGTVRAVLGGARDLPDGPFELLVRRDDPGDYVLPADRAGAARDLAVLVAQALLVVVAGLAATVVLRARPVAVPAAPALGDPPRPGPLPSPPDPMKGVLGHLAVAALMLVVAGGWTSRATDALDSRGRLVTVRGLVAEDDLGVPVVRYRDPDSGEIYGRPLTGTEIAAQRGIDMPVTVRTKPAVPAKRDTAPTFLAVAAAVGIAALVRIAVAVRWPRRLRAAAACDPAATDVVVWSRRSRAATWLLVAPPDATTAREVLAIRLGNGAVPPPPTRARLWVHGPLRGGRLAVVRAPDGTPWWPDSSACGPVAAAAHLVAPDYSGA